MRFNFKDILVLMRCHQYIKNLFVFLPLFFAAKITDFELLGKSGIALVAFSLTASAVYILNDLQDIEDDRNHAKKKHRPLAAGVISKTQAIVIMAVLFILGFSLIAALPPMTTAVLAVYVMVNLFYSFSLKYIAILDVTIIAIGFVLRLFIGSVASDIPLSKWIVIMTFLLALFLALAKRRDDVLIFMHSGKKMRKVIDSYSLQFLDIAMAIMAAVVIVSYTIYTTSSEEGGSTHSDYLYITALFVIIGIMRYLQITFVLKDSGSPTRIALEDRFIQLTLIGWVITFTWILYG